MQEFPPLEGAGRQESPPGIPTQIRQAREALGLTWYAVAKLAGLTDAGTVRDIKYGRDSPMSTLQQASRALGLPLEFVEKDYSSWPRSVLRPRFAHRHRRTGVGVPTQAAAPMRVTEPILKRAP